MDIAKSCSVNDSWELIPLTPKYIEKEHGSYVEVLTKAIKDEKVINVALSGNYGVGKSSILHEFAQRHEDQVVEISLSTIAPPIAEDQGQATTLTNRIQKEIVKQLLYREQPFKTQGSRFRRIERFRLWREVANSGLVSIGVMVLFLLTGWTAKMSTALLPTTYLGSWEHILLLILAFLFSFTVRYQSYGRLHIKQFSAGSATITLDDNSISYFDQYLDEIVYFFEVSKRTIVVFEDIDRFDDSHIFETLRSLNRLLNSAPQIGKKICFIYAIKDSIFDYGMLEAEKLSGGKALCSVEDPAQIEVVRANRTKFFDLVIPVVPFITHRSARDLLQQTLEGIEHKLKRELLDLAGRYVPDMRLLKNVRNEFIVFRDRIFSGPGEKLNLDENELLAMMLYKSTHLADFELIRQGKSKLDKLYENSRKIVAENLRRIESEISALQKSSNHLKSIDERSKELGRKLLAHMELTARHAGYAWKTSGLSFNNQQLSEQNLQQSTFWREFILMTDDAVIVYVAPHNWNQKLSFTRKDVSSALNITLDKGHWEVLGLEQQEEHIAKLKDDLKFLRSADMGCLIKRDEFTSLIDEEEQNLNTSATKLLTNGLAYQLVRANAINRNFTLYTATFHGNFVSPAARSFIIHHVEQDKMDAYYQLNEDEVNSVIQECGLSVLGEPSFYNISILDCLLGTRPQNAYPMIKSLISFGYEQTAFIQAYLSSGKYADKLVARLSFSLAQIFNYLISTADVDEDNRQKLVNAALANMGPRTVYQLDTVELDYIRSNYASFDTLTSGALVEKQISPVVQLFLRNDIKVVALAPLSDSVREALIKHSLYELNIDNLRVAVGDDDRNLSLDVLCDKADDVYTYVMASLPKYLDLVDGVTPTIVDATYFIAMIENVYEVFPDQLDRVVSRADASCTVLDINKLGHELWPCLAEHLRFPASFENIKVYTDVFGGIDSNLAKVLLSARKITGSKSASEEDKQALAILVLSESEELPDPSLRVEIVSTMDLDEYIDVGFIPAESGELFALLVDASNNLIADDANTYEHIGHLDWLTKESFIQRSERFSRYITSVLLTGDLAPLLLSPRIDLNKKRAIVARADDLVHELNSQDVIQLTQFALRNNCHVSIDVICAAASAGAKQEDIIALLEPNLIDITNVKITNVMIDLGGNYEALTYTGWDHPKLPNNRPHRALLDRLKEIGIVSTLTESESYIKVNKKRGSLFK